MIVRCRDCWKEFEIWDNKDYIFCEECAKKRAEHEDKLRDQIANEGDC